MKIFVRHSNDKRTILTNRIFAAMTAKLYFSQILRRIFPKNPFLGALCNTLLHAPRQNQKCILMSDKNLPGFTFIAFPWLFLDILSWKMVSLHKWSSKNTMKKCFITFGRSSKFEKMLCSTNHWFSNYYLMHVQALSNCSWQNFTNGMYILYLEGLFLYRCI